MSPGRCLSVVIARRFAGCYAVASAELPPDGLHDQFCVSEFTGLEHFDVPEVTRFDAVDLCKLLPGEIIGQVPGGGLCGR